jgi:hypothetical protein
MNLNATGLNARRLRTSITAIVTAILLVGSVQCIVIALEEPLRPAATWLINLAIDQGHFHLSRVFSPGVIWPVVILNLLNGAVGLYFSYWLARWNFNKGGKTQDT